VLRLTVQIVGFALGVASLVWCVRSALADKNREQLSLLLHAPAYLIASMIGLSVASLTINGLLFWITLVPVRHLPIRAVMATHSVACFLAYLPLKLGAVARVVIHNRRDHVPLAMIGAWFSAMLAVMAVALAPPVGASLIFQRVGGAWWATVLVAEVVGGAILVGAARAFRGTHGLERLSRVLGAIPVLPLSRFLRTKLWGDLHSGFDMLSSPPAVAGAVVLRLMDLGVQTSRILVAAAILKLDVPPAQALLVSLAYFLIGIVNPSGLAGLREGGATLAAAGVLAWFGTSATATDAFAPLVLLVTATEAVAFAMGGVLGGVYLRPDRLFWPKASAGTGSTSSTPPEREPSSSPQSASQSGSENSR
jgi:hypothetical protein